MCKVCEALILKICPNLLLKLGAPIMQNLTHCVLTNSWFITSGIDTWGPYNRPAWTMSTLFFFYLVFPPILTFLQTFTTKQLVTLTVWLFHFQVLNTDTHHSKYVFTSQLIYLTIHFQVLYTHHSKMYLVHQ